MIKKLLKFIFRLFISIGINPKDIINLKYFLRYLKTEQEWLKQGGRINKRFIFLNDFNSNAGLSSGEYFHQDLLVAKMINEANPKKHIDVGSRIDGFVSHVASFRRIEVLDIRPLEESIHENIKFIQADLMNTQNIEKTDSLSCLHAIEHFGLGRYNDPIDVNGHIKGINNLIALLESGGTFYISFPIGRKDEIFFNANRVFHPQTIFSIPSVKKSLILSRFDYIDEDGDLHLDKKINSILSNIKYGCGIYTFKKL
tara:strand:- start:3637 stop:4404 length:768 start_codon:yes stop_codon:yes gene_type:complete